MEREKLSYLTVEPFSLYSKPEPYEEAYVNVEIPIIGVKYNLPTSLRVLEFDVLENGRKAEKDTDFQRVAKQLFQIEAGYMEKFKLPTDYELASFSREETFARIRKTGSHTLGWLSTGFLTPNTRQTFLNITSAIMPFLQDSQRTEFKQLNERFAALGMQHIPQLRRS